MTDYEEYLDKYCKSKGITREVAEQRALVKAYAEYCKEKATRIEPDKTEIVCGCGGAN